MKIILRQDEVPSDLEEYFEPVEVGGMRSVLSLGPEPLKEAHFAAFPSAIPRTCIQASTSERGCCPTCGAPWARVVKRETVRERSEADGGTLSLTYAKNRRDAQAGVGGIQGFDAWTGLGGRAGTPRRTTLAWRPTCTCPKHEPIPCTVMDIFAGSGTTLRVAEDLGRLWFGIDLSDQYLPLIKKRTAQRTILGLVGRMAVKKNMSRK